jgi:hypothetical protein
VARIITIADAVTAAINAAAELVDPEQPAARRAYMPRPTPETLKTLTIFVVARARTIAPLDRGRDAFEYVVDVGVFHRPAPLDAATLDGLMLLVEEIGDLFRKGPLAGVDDVTCVGVANDPIYDQDRLDQFGEFASVLSLTYREWRMK